MTNKIQAETNEYYPDDFWLYKDKPGSPEFEETPEEPCPACGDGYCMCDEGDK